MPRLFVPEKTMISELSFRTDTKKLYLSTSHDRSIVDSTLDVIETNLNRLTRGRARAA